MAEKKGTDVREEKGIQIAKEEWTPHLTDIWTEAFGDSRSVAELFYTHFPADTCAVCYVEEGIPVSVIHVLKARVWVRGGMSKTVWYLYAGATRRDCRGRGYYACLIHELCSKAKQSGDRGPVLLLVPVPDKIKYYRGLGFHIIKNTADVVLHPGFDADKTGKDEELFIRHIDMPRYKQLRDQLLGSAGYVEWKQDYLSYALESIQGDGGIALELTWSGIPHIMLAKKQDKRLRILETSLKKEETGKLAGSLGRLLACDEISIKGMLWMSTWQKWEENAYCSVVLDE